MIQKLRSLVMQLPIVRILRRHRDERCAAEMEKQELLDRQHEIARRVHVIEWQTFPHTHAKRERARDDH